MREATAKEKVLKKIRKALINKAKDPYSNADFDTNVYPELEETAEITFAQKFTEAAGKFVFCEDTNEVIENLNYFITENNWQNLFCKEPVITDLLKKAQIKFNSGNDDLEFAEVGITLCEYLIARTGSIMISSKQASGRRTPIYPPVQIVVAYTSQIVIELKDALKAIKTKYPANFPSLISFITGPSRTADIENTLVIGAHGPKDVYVFLIDDMPYQDTTEEV